MIGVDKDYTEVTPDGASGGAGVGGVGGTVGTGTGGSGVGGTGTGGISGASGKGGTGGATGTGGLGGATGTGGTLGDATGGSEICNNGIDDDADGRIDCFDPDCLSATACAGMCMDAGTLPCGVPRAIQNTGAAGSTQRIAPPAYNCTTQTLTGPEYAYKLESGSNQDVIVELYGLSADLGVFAVEAVGGGQCDATQACVASDGPAGSATTPAPPHAMGFSTTLGRDYYVIVDGAAAADFSIVAQCSTQGGCQPVTAIQAGQTINGNNTIGNPNVTDVLGVYSCAGGNHTGGEASYIFTPTVTGNYRVDLTNLTENFDIFIVGAPTCTSTCLNSLARSVNVNLQNESVTFSATADTSYYIVLDCYGAGSFTLTVTGPL